MRRLKESPALLVRERVLLGGAVGVVGGVAACLSGGATMSVEAAAELFALVVVGALTRGSGIPLPGHGFSSYILGVIAYAVLDHGWPFGVVLAPLALAAGDLGLRRLPAATTLSNAAHLTVGTALAGLAYQRLGGAVGEAPPDPPNFGPPVAFPPPLPPPLHPPLHLHPPTPRSPPSL